MGRGLGAVQREVLDWLQAQWQEGESTSWHRTMDQFVIGAGHPLRGGTYYPPPHRAECLCRVCWVAANGLTDTEDKHGYYKPENWGKGEWCKFYPEDEARYQADLAAVPAVDPVSKRETYRRALRTLIDRGLVVGSESSLELTAPVAGGPVAEPARWRRGTIRPTWRAAIKERLTGEWVAPWDLCELVLEALEPEAYLKWKESSEQKQQERFEENNAWRRRNNLPVVEKKGGEGFRGPAIYRPEGIEHTYAYHRRFRPQLNELRKRGEVEVLRKLDYGEPWICDGQRTEGRVIGVRLAKC